MTMTDGSRLGSLHVINGLDEAAWRAFVEEHPRGGVFHTPEMFEVFARTKGHRPELWAVVDDASEVQALMTPVHVTLRGGLLDRFTTRSIAYGGVLSRDSSRGEEALRRLLTSYAQSVGGHSLFTEIRNLHDETDRRSIVEASGFAHEDHLNYLISLDAPVDEILHRIVARTRKGIQKGLRVGDVTIREVTDPAEMEPWYRILEGTYEHAHVPLADRSLFDAAFELLRPRGMARFVLAHVDGAPIACSVELLYKDTAYAWYGGSDRAFNTHRPNDLIIWNVLEWGARHGYREYDFGGAGKPDEDYGVRDFKAKFGGRLVSYGRFTRVHAPRRLALSTAGFRLYQKLR